MQQHYDVIVIGAGINGCATAYELANANQKVLLVDKEGIASGGSGAAGAFISPKFSKAGELKEIINEAFVYSMHYYQNNFPFSFIQRQLIHIAKDEKEAKVLSYFKQNTTLELRDPSLEDIKLLCCDLKTQEYISLDAGIVDAPMVCRSMAQKADFLQYEVQTLHYKDGVWFIGNGCSAKHIVLATGAYQHLLQEEYIALRGVWGHRIDIKTSTRNPYSIHQFVSISSTTEDQLAIGATHDVHYHPQHATHPYDYEKGREELLAKASKTVQLEDVQVIKDYTGLRSGSFDYLPLVGPLVDSQQTLACCEKKLRVKKPDDKSFIYYPNLTMINGSGGYGFVLAPFLAKILKKYILDQQEIPKSLLPTRFFVRWAKRRK